MELCPEVRSAIEAALVEDPPLAVKEGGLIRPGYHAELDRLRSVSKDGKSWIARYQADQIRRTGIPGLKVGFNQVFGYYIEITHAQAQRVEIPSDYIRKQTVKNAERYFTPELKEFENEVRTADDRAHAAGVRVVHDAARPGLGRCSPADPGRLGAGPARRPGRAG